jgi:hypothetical protein
MESHPSPAWRTPEDKPTSAKETHWSGSIAGSFCSSATAAQLLAVIGYRVISHQIAFT